LAGFETTDCAGTGFVTWVAVGGASALAWAHAIIGDAIQSRDSKRAGVFMAFPWRAGGLAGRFGR